MNQRDINKLEKAFDVIKDYHEQYGSVIILDVSLYQETYSALQTARAIYENYTGDIPQDVADKYASIGMIWDSAEAQQIRKDILSVMKAERMEAVRRAQEEANWENCYELAEQYSKIFGSLTIPKNFEMFGVKLGEWLKEQKDAYSKMELSIDRAYKLSEIGIEWDCEKDHVSYDESIIAYYVSKCFSDVVSSYRPPELMGKELDVYIPSLKTGIEFDGAFFHRDKLHKDLQKNQLCKEYGYRLIRVRPQSLPTINSDENCTVVTLLGHKNNTTAKAAAVKEVLSALGIDEKDMPSINIQRDKHEITGIMVEDKTFFNQYLMAASKFAKTYGHLLVPKDYEDPTGIRLGKWIVSVRNSRQWLTQKQVNALDDIGMVWRDIKKEMWLTNFEMVKSFNGKVPEYAITTEGRPLKEWYEQQKSDFTKERMKCDYKISAMKSLHIRDKNRGADER